MNFTKTMFALAIGSVGIMGAMSAHAALGDLANGDVLTITAGAQGTTTYGAPNAFATGSWFAMDTGAPVGNIGQGEQILLAPGAGITIGSFSAPGNYGATAGSATPVVATWAFNSNTGTNYFNSAIGAAPTGGVSTGINMSAWDVAWATTSSFNMGSGDWSVVNVGQVGMADVNGATAGSGLYGDGIAKFNWSGVYGDTYTLDYTATVPSGGFAGTQYALHLTGTVMAAAPVPEASTYGMMLAGLGLVGFAVRRRKLI